MTHFQQQMAAQDCLFYPLLNSAKANQDCDKNVSESSCFCCEPSSGHIYSLENRLCPAAYPEHLTPPLFFLSFLAYIGLNLIRHYG